GEPRPDEGRRVERLLVSGTRRGLAAPAPFVAGQPQEPVRKSALVTEPRERLQPGGDSILAAEGRPADDQRMRQASIVVGVIVLEPAPPVVRARLICGLELRHATLEQTSRIVVEAVGVETRETER